MRLQCNVGLRGLSIIAASTGSEALQFADEGSLGPLKFVGRSLKGEGLPGVLDLCTLLVKELQSHTMTQTKRIGTC